MIQLSNADYAALIAERDQLAVRASDQANVLEALQRLDFNLRVDGGEGLPVEACKIIDTVLTN